MIDLRSDTVTQPTAAMRRVMAEAEVGDDGYGEDPTVNRLESEAARLLKKPAALYVPTATMANQLAVLSHTERGDEIFLDEDAHIYYYEAGAPAMLAGVTCHLLPHTSGVIDPQVLEAAIRPANVHHPRPRLLVVEDTHNRSGGAAVPGSMLAPAAAVARQHDLAVHMDGARLFNAAVALSIAPGDLAADMDSVTLCLSKGLGAPLGALLVGSAAFIDRARRYRKQLGGAMRQAGIVAAAGLYGLEYHVQRLSGDHQRAQALAAELSQLPGFRVVLPPVPTNMVMVDVLGPVDRLLRDAQAAGIRLGTVGPQRLRLVTHLDIGDADVEVVAAFFRRAAAQG
ncbi:MAG: low-specificity L-threonine aldolase [Thermaerobacter sp.]|nr:low-specificity L-threonine aldolase [Thermaerobacter sp.]